MVHYILDTDDIIRFDKIERHGMSSIGKDGVTGDDTQIYPLYGTTAKTVCEGNDARIPTTDEKAAMTGTNSPSATNPFATKADIADIKTAIEELKRNLKYKGQKSLKEQYQ